MQINYEMVPKTYAHCVSQACPLADQCLRSIAWKIRPKSMPQIIVVNPYTVTENEDCPHFRSNKPTRVARGFAGMKRKMLPDCYSEFSLLLIEYFGIRVFYKIRRGVRPITPEEEKLIRKALRMAGADENLDFDNYEDAILWE